MSLDIELVRRQFPALAETDAGVRRIYFDNPAGTQVLVGVVEVMRRCLLEGNANLGGPFETSRRADEFVADGQAAMVDFLNAPAAEEIIFGQNMTTLTLHLSRSLGREFAAGDNIVLSRMDHDANVEPWRLMAKDFDLEVRWLAFDTSTYEFDLAALDDLLDERTRLVCVGGASNMTGTLNDVQAIAAKARSAGALSFIDAVQSAPHVVSDVQALGCDFYACSAYKFFGPHQGILWGRHEVLERLMPYKVRPAPATLPWAFQTGTQSHEGIAGTGAAVDYFANIGASMCDGDRRACIVAGFNAMFDYEKVLAERLVSGLLEIGGVTVHGITDTDAFDRRVPTVAFVHESKQPDEIARALGEHNIFVWSGHNYAVEPARLLGIEEHGVVRVGPVHYNTVEEIDETLSVIREIVA
ncbi:MAG: cysteine desulfurase-like protein [Pseudomonadota bacterium]